MADTRLIWTESATGTSKLAEHPQEPRSDQIPSVDAILKRNDKQIAQQLQQKYKQAQGLIDKEIAQSRQAIINQYKIKRNDMERRYNAEIDPKRKQAILDQTMSVRSQIMAKIQALTDKHAPMKQEIDTQMQAEVQKMTQQNGQRDFRLQTIRQLVQAGDMDPIKAKKAEYKMIGINWEPPAQEQTLEDRKKLLIRDIRNIDGRLKQFTPEREKVWADPGVAWWGKKKATIVDELTGEERELDPKNEADAAELQNIAYLNTAKEDMIKELQNIYIMENPAIRKEIEDTQCYNDAKNIVKNGGRGNLETMGVVAKGKPAKGKLIQMRAPDGRTGSIPQKNIAAALAQGYKRIQ